MDTTPKIDRRLTDLEIKASFTEDLLDQLNQVIVRQQQEIAMLIREVQDLRLQIPDKQDVSMQLAIQNIPPHY